MAITNHDRVGKAMELLKGGLGPFVEREFKSTYKDRAAAELQRYLGRRPPEREEGGHGTGRGGAAQDHVGILERRVPPDARARRAQPGERAARPSQQVGAPGDLLQRRRLPRPRLGRPPADRRLGPAGRRDREDEDGASAASLRRAGAQREAQERRHRDRGRRGGRPQALARGGDAAQGRGQRPLPAGRVCRRPLAGPPWRGDRRVQEPRRVLPPHLSHREPQEDAGRRGAAHRRPGRRSGGAAPDQLRRRQDALDAGALPPVLGHRPHRADGHRRGAGGGRGQDAADRPARGAGGQQDLARQPLDQARRDGGAHALGRAGLAARRQEGVRPHPGRRREGDQPRRRAARAVQRVRAEPDPDRRVGSLRAPAPRPGRPAGWQLRDAVHLRPGADRVGQAGQELPARDQPPGLRYLRIASHPGRRRRGGRPARPRGARSAAERCRPGGVLVAPGERRGGVRDRPPAAVRAAGRSCPVS